MKGRCLNCGELFIGRNDKKFCGDYCRNSFNNQLNQDFNNLMRRTHNILRKNYRILRGLQSLKGSKKISKSELSTEGFNFELCTSTYITKQGKSYYFIYDLGYLNLNQKQLIIVKKEAYL